MPKVMVEVEIPDGWELVRYGEPEIGEHYLSDSLVVCRSLVTRCDHKRVVVRPGWQWPEWLKAPWIAMDNEGKWYAYQHEPELCDWGWRSAHRWMLENFWAVVFNFTPPTCTDWRQSKRRNPRAAAPAAGEG